MKALQESDGDIEKSKEYLRKKGLAQAEKKVGRVAQQGLVGARVDYDNRKITLIQFACETDFVAKTDNFKNGLKQLLDTLHHKNDILVDMKQSNDEAYIDEVIKRCDTLLKPLDADLSH